MAKPNQPSLLQRMKLLEVIASADLRGGGPIEAVLQRARIFKDAGHEVELVTLDSPGQDFSIPADVPVHRLGPSRFGYGYSGRLAPWLKDKAPRFDAAVVNGLWHYASFGTWLGLRNVGTPYFVFPHGMLDPWFKRTYPLKHLKKWLYWPWAEYRVLRDAHSVLFTCEEECRLARQSFWLYRCRERVVGLGIAQPKGDPERQRSQLFQRFPELRDKRLVLFLGRIHPKKGCDLVVRAFAELVSSARSDRPRPLHLVLAGPDQVGWLEQLQALAKGLGITRQISFPGMLAGDVKFGALHAAEVFVLPSHQENFGIAVAEALACGVPVLISNKVNIWREVEQDGAGLVENDDSAGTRRLFQRWFSLKADEQRVYRANARRCFESRFEIRRASDALLKVLNEHAVVPNGHLL
jgi:glycosyltransferase involved in cell wall biosynthesis